MSAPALYEASVPVLLRYLGSLRTVLQALARLPDAAQSLDAQLAPGMLNFAAQVATATQFALRTAFPLAGRAVPPAPDEARGFETLDRRIGEVSALLLELDPDAFADAGALTISDPAGQAIVRLAGAEFLHQYALPNFFFHLNMAYAIARSRGADLGKGDYDGFHTYAPGTRFG